MNTDSYKDLSMVAVAEALLKENKEPISIYELLDQVAKIKDISVENTEALTQLYMDITLSGKFVFVGDDRWSLKEGNLEYWDKDGYAFVTPDEEEIINEVDAEDLDLADFVLEEELDADLDDDLDLDAEELEEQEYLDVAGTLVSTDDDDLDDIDLDLDDSYDEDDYNDIMDDYEDMYED